MTRLRYRRFRDDDLPGVFRLWVEAGWVLADDASWGERFMRALRADGRIVLVAVDGEGEVAAVMVLRPTHVQVDGEVVPALRLIAPILRPDIRRRRFHSPDHPAVRLLDLGARIARRRRYRLLYGFPRASWAPVFRWAAGIDLWRFEALERPCWAAPIAPRDGIAARADGLSPGPAADLGDDYGDLWDRARREIPISCGVVRESSWLRSMQTLNTIVEVRDARGALAGYASFRREDGLLTDLLAERRARFGPVLGAAMGWLALHREGRIEPCVERVKAMATPETEEALSTLGFEPDDFTFCFACCSLDPSLPSEAVSPSRWYLAAGS